jgi:hypothetical protein
MGLAIEVGPLADLLENDPEGAQWLQENFVQLNKFLLGQKLPPHNEPTRCEIFSCDMFGYSGLHYLRRIAAHLDLRNALPPPGNDEVIDNDEAMAEYLELAMQESSDSPDCVPNRKKRSFDHLLIHSDAEGFYLPQDFELVLTPAQEFEIPGDMVGSSQRLYKECQRLAAALELPPDLDPNSETIHNAADSQGTGASKWQQYGVESYICLQLLQACEHSIQTGAAIVFC